MIKLIKEFLRYKRLARELETTDDRLTKESKIILANSSKELEKQLYDMSRVVLFNQMID